MLYFFDVHVVYNVMFYDDFCDVRAVYMLCSLMIFVMFFDGFCDLHFYFFFVIFNFYVSFI